MSDRHEQSRALHARAQAMIEAYRDRRPVPEAFDSLASDLGRYQARYVPGYARLCSARGLEDVRRPSDFPAVPTDAFKLARVFAFDESDAAATFRTSGTTIGTRGVHPFRDLRTYDAAALSLGRVMLAAGLPEGAPVVILGPSARDAPDSSLAHMCTLFARSLGRAGDAEDAHFIVADAHEATIAVDALRTRVRSLRRGDAAIVLAASFALVHLLDVLDGEILALPPGSRIMQTGGYKGRSREVSPPELRRAVARCFEIDERSVVGEYGMTELSSQFWEATLVDDRAPHGVYVEPPWARVVPVHPETLDPVAEGDVGIARIEDLANVDSAWAVLTQDRVRRSGNGFELLGRTEGAPARGCSIALDEMLSISR